MNIKVNLASILFIVQTNSNMHKNLFLFSLLFLSTLSAASQALWNDGYNAYITPINSIDVQCENNSDLEYISNAINNAKVIGLGEATHGTREFAQIRHRLIKHLVINHGIRVFVIEDAFANTSLINQYITGQKTGDTEVFIKNWMRVWRIEEMKHLLDWFMAYNKDKPEKEKVQVYGCDMQNFIGTSISIKNELKQLSRLSNSIEEGLDLLIQHRHSHKLSKVQKKTIQEMMNELKMLDWTGIENDKQTLQLTVKIRVLEQGIDLLYTNGFKRTLKRDRYMAENVQHIMGIEKNKRMVIWAHNQHTANKACQSARTPMGKHLKEAIGDAYYALGTAFCYGSLYAYNTIQNKTIICEAGAPKEDCIDLSFAEAKYSNFFIKLNDEKTLAAMPELLTSKVYSRRNGFYPENEQHYNRNYRKHIMTNSFDGLIFFKETTPVLPLD